MRDRDNGAIVIGELKEPGERLVVAKGGIGGRGNASTKVCMDHDVLPQCVTGLYSCLLAFVILGYKSIQSRWS